MFPKELERRIPALAASKEPTAYHPEGNTWDHIKIVGIKAWVLFEDRDLFGAAMFHDICKADSGDSLKGYWSNPLHPKQAYELLHSDDQCRYFLKQIGADFKTVADICLWHMACKDGIPKKAQSIPKIGDFVYIDDMIERFPLRKIKKNVHLPDYQTYRYWSTVGFVGQAPIDIGKGQMTVCVNRTAFKYTINDLFKHVINLL